MSINYLRIIIIIILLCCTTKSSNANQVIDSLEYWGSKLEMQWRTRVSDMNTSIEIGTNIINECNNDSLKAHSYATLGISYANNGDYLNAFYNCQKAKEDLLLYGATIDYFVFNNITLIEVYKYIGLIKRAIIESKKTFEIINKKDKNNYYLLGIMNGVYANLLAEQNNIDECLYYYSESIKYIEKVSDEDQQEYKKLFLAQLYSEMANVYYNKADYVNANIYINKSNSLINEDDFFKSVRLYNTIRLGLILYNTNNIKESVELLEPLRFEQNISHLLRLNVQNALYQYYKSINDSVMLNMTSKIIDSLKLLSISNQSSTIKEAVNQIENEIEQIENEKINQTIIYITIIIVFIIFIILGIILYRKNIQSEKRKYEEIKSKIENDYTNKEILNIYNNQIIRENIINDDYLIEQNDNYELEILNSELVFNDNIANVETSSKISYIINQNTNPEDIIVDDISGSNSIDKNEKTNIQLSSDETLVNNFHKSSVEYTNVELQLLNKLEKFVTKKKYLKKDITLASLAIDLKTNPTYLSDIINKAYEKNFNTFINELRIEYITKEIYLNSDLLDYKIGYLADMCGFNSHNTFALVFKKINGITPSAFIQQRRNDINH